jgi:hypothetical protein
MSSERRTRLLPQIMVVAVTAWEGRSGIIPLEAIGVCCIYKGPVELRHRIEPFLPGKIAARPTRGVARKVIVN